MRHKKLIVFGVSVGFACGLLAGLAPDAAAWFYVRLSGNACQPSSPNSPHAYIVDGEESRLRNTDPVNSASFICPVPDNSEIPMTSMSSIDVWVTDGSASSGAWAKACAFNAYQLNSGGCGTMASSSGTGGFKKLNPGLGALVTSGETAYLWVDLPAGGSSNIDTIYFLKP